MANEKKKSTGRARTQKTEKRADDKKIIKKNTVTAKKFHRKSTVKKPPKKEPKPAVRIAFLGGLNEIGKNLTVFECLDDMIILDCGMAFPDGDMLGVDMVIPDYTYLEQNKEKIRGVVITHGHEDHIGGLPYLLSKMKVPIYGTPLTVGLIANKLKEHSHIDAADLQSRNAGDHIKLGCFDVELIHVNHSIPDSVGVAIHSPAGTIVHTGDFKIDYTPMSGGMIDLSRFAQLGDEGVLALLADSTNAGRQGYTPTEQKVADSFDTLFRRARHSRIIIATFASNISRIQQIINCAEKNGRKVAFSGRSMINYMNVAKELGYLEVNDSTIIDIDRLKDYPPEKIVLATTGSQGEPMSALSRMAYSDHRKVEVGAGDFIIISANPIPGNERTVGNVVDELLKRGCEVVYESMYEVHVSGHACTEELKLIHSLVKPKYFIPVHGEQKHLRKHMSIAQSLGMDRKNIYVGDIGKVVEISEEGMKEAETVTAGKVFVDGLGVGDVGSIVLRDRKHLGQDGLIIIVASLDVYDGHVISGPDIVSRGFVYVRESGDLMDEIKELSLEILDTCSRKNIHEWGVIKNKLKDDVAKLINKETGRSPMILPILMEV
ncbi:MAG: ribonuclease J [Ruminococcus sp.]|nr:ribonuclease J [Ruminococcus sp.]